MVVAKYSSNSIWDALPILPSGLAASCWSMPPCTLCSVLSSWSHAVSSHQLCERSYIRLHAVRLQSPLPRLQNHEVPTPLLALTAVPTRAPQASSGGSTWPAPWHGSLAAGQARSSESDWSDLSPRLRAAGNPLLRASGAALAASLPRMKSRTHSSLRSQPAALAGPLVFRATSCDFLASFGTCWLTSPRCHMHLLLHIQTQCAPSD